MCRPGPFGSRQAGKDQIRRGVHLRTAPTWGLQTIINNANTSSAAGLNAFYTNRRGSAWVFIPLDFRMSNGLYPFSRYQASLADVGLANMPFTFAIVSHCTDNKQAGLPPGMVEPTFAVSLN